MHVVILRAQPLKGHHVSGWSVLFALTGAHEPQCSVKFIGKAVGCSLSHAVYSDTNAFPHPSALESFRGSWQLPRLEARNSGRAQRKAINIDKLEPASEGSELRRSLVSILGFQEGSGEANQRLM